MSDGDLVGDIFGWVGTVIAIYFYVAPAVPFIKVLKGELSYKDSPGILLICSFMNCILWADYGLVNNKFLVYFANGIGGTITLIWITIYLFFLAKKNVGLACLFNLGLIAGVTGLLLLFFYVIDVVITGYVAMVFNILMYAAPGEKIFKVVTTKDYKLIPIFSTVGGFLCSLCWFMYGFISEDINLIIPNGLGLFFAILQIIAYLFYYCKSKNENKDFPGENEDVV
jgi:solute carrier family 50 protein (sugar transporter)